MSLLCSRCGSLLQVVAEFIYIAFLVLVWCSTVSSSFLRCMCCHKVRVEFDRNETTFGRANLCFVPARS